MKHDNDNTPPLRFLSVCSGIEAASVAFGPLGWEAVAFSEIEKFPSLVLKHHYPDVPNLGDFTKIDCTILGRVDILCGGTPCQAFSVAGARKGLKDARGNLTLSFVELAHELANGNGLRNVIWENVVGVLSDKTNAFGCFLAGLVGAESALPPPARGKWPNAGMVIGPKGRAAWRIFDAQYFGVAQRRRRVLVVADLGNGADPVAVLFERAGMHGNSPPRREAGKDVAAFSASSLGSYRQAEVSGAVRAAGGDNGGGSENPVAFAPEIARCVATREGSSQDYETTTMVAVAFNANAKADQLPSASRDTSLNDGLTVSQRAAVAVAFVQNSRDEVRIMNGDGQIVGALAAAQCAKQQCYLAQSVAIRGREGGATAEFGGEVATALRASQGGGDKPHVLTSAVRRLTPKECERLQGFPDNYTRIPLRAYKQPRYTKNRPADMWEFIDGQWWLMSADGPRYKSLGNSWAVPKFKWLGGRLARMMPIARNWH